MPLWLVPRWNRLSGGSAEPALPLCASMTFLPSLDGFPAEEWDLRSRKLSIINKSDLFIDSARRLVFVRRACIGAVRRRGGPNGVFVGLVSGSLGGLS